MKEQKVKFLKGSISKLDKKGDQISVIINGEEELFDNILLAVGRSPSTDKIGLKELGVKFDEKGKIFVNDQFQTNIDNIYCVGDNIHNSLELTPVAVKEG